MRLCVKAKFIAIVDLPSLPIAEVTKMVLGGLSIFEKNKPVLMVFIFSAKLDRLSSRYCFLGFSIPLVFLTKGLIPKLETLSFFQLWLMLVTNNKPLISASKARCGISCFIYLNTGQRS